MASWTFNFRKTARRLKAKAVVLKRASAKSWRQLRHGARPSSSEDQPLHLELFSHDQLEKHARDLATKHRIAKGRGKDLLLQRLADNESALIKAYESLSLAVRAKERISPAAEWLLDNFHVIEEQIRTARRHLPPGYSRELPHLQQGKSVGFPRVYDIALEVIAHVDGRIDQENITAFVAAYQQVSKLNLGEFWAIPIMLRLALIENLRRVACRVVVGMNDRKTANYWADQLLTVAEKEPKNLILVAADMARSKCPTSNSFVAEFVRRLHGQGQALDIPLTWIEQQLLEAGSNTQQTVQLESQQQAANQVSVGASIGSLRFLSAMDWRDFVESLSSIDRTFINDPANVYPEMNFATRDRYRHVIEHLAKQTKRPEEDVSNAAIALAAGDHDDPRARHVGYYLVDKGLALLENAMHLNAGFAASLRSTNGRLALYLGSIAALTVLISGVVLAQLETVNIDYSVFAALTLLLLLCSSQVAVALVNWLAMIWVKPSLMPRLDFSKGIPSEHRTLVAVPSMLLSPRNIASLLESLEVRYLANRDENLHYALLTDFADAKTEKLSNDLHLIKLATAGIEGLNAKYACKGHDVFFLLHRPRKWNPQQGVWMGHERKRGKLEALNAYLRNPVQTSFSVVVGDLHAFSPIKYVITLDTDTQLPRDAARELAATMAHPLNRPHYDAKLGRVTRGYSILQPRVGISLPNARHSRFAMLFSGDAGIDPYTRAISDVYQDLFAEGSFIGKGIYDVDAFTTSLAGKFPDNLILSHDLIEGSYARCGLVSDVLLYEDFPANYSDDAKRRSRWVRGDWQIIQWIFPYTPGPDRKARKSSLSLLSRWKIFDNLRRSLVPVSTLALLGFSWFFGTRLGDPWFMAEAVLIMNLLPQLLASLAEAARKPNDVPLDAHAVGVVSGTARRFIHGLLTMVFLPFEAYLSASAILRTLFRVFVSKKRLLEWRSASDAKSSSTDLGSFYTFMIFAPITSLALLAFMVYRPQHLGLITPFALMWLFSPALASWLSRPLPEREVMLTDDQTTMLRLIARKTWRFFETFVGPDDHWLPPDNFQEYPAPIVAHRTSPTNMGLALLANLSAYDFGYASASEVMTRTKLSLDTMEKLDRFRGHFYNWYDTTSLLPLPPLYVSTVDSGNLVGLLLTLRQGFLDLPHAKIIPPQTYQGLIDTCSALAEFVSAEAEITEAVAAIRSAQPTLSAALSLYERLRVAIAAISTKAKNDDATWWLDALTRQSRGALVDSQSPLATLQSLAPMPEGLIHGAEINALIDQMDKIPSWSELAKLSQTLGPMVDAGLAGSVSEAHKSWYLSLQRALADLSAFTGESILACETLARRCGEMANVEYEFLYDKTRNLFTIGYNVSDHRRDSGFYDLLASEARLGSFVAIAQGALPQEHWFTLGRLLTTWRNESTLLSWSGSMFEYLMPLLVLPTFRNTLLDETHRTAVRRQIAYGNEHGIPWGVSESGYNTTDVNLNYQYRAFGVPGLGFKRGLAEDLVLAPYASVMAIMVEPKEATVNMQRMRDEGFEGRYGFYEAVDYTPSRLSAGQTHAIVRSFMAHHQGMSFLALAYQLLDRKMQARFQAEPLFKATELLLHERIPKAVKLYPHAPEVSDPQLGVAEQVPTLRILPADTPRPEVHLLSNGRYTVMITNSGGGYSRWKDLSLTRWREDPTSDNWGTFCYLRDVTSGDIWSAAHQPTLKTPTHYEAIFPQGRAEFRRRDHDLELHTEIAISPEDDIELRRFSMTNLGSTKRVIEFTSYAEVVLAPQAVDEAHPAFSNLFIQTEVVPSKHAILCKRRPRSDSDKTPTMFHLMTAHGATIGAISYETDRARFLGRGGHISEPKALRSGDAANEALSGASGSVLDPIIAIRCRVEIEPEQTIRVHVVTGVGERREDALALAEKYLERHLADRVFELAWTHRQVVLRQLDVTEADAQLYGRLASSIIYANPQRRANAAILVKNRRGQSGLWGYGISGDLPIVVLRIKNSEHANLVRQMVQAHGYWRSMGLAVDLIIWNEDESSYRQNLHDGIMEMIAAGSYLHHVDKPGGIFVRRSDQMSEEDRTLLQTVARAIISDASGSLKDQVERRSRRAKTGPVFVAKRLPNELPGSASALWEPKARKLLFDNGTGGFSGDGREYIITTSKQQSTPAPWSNVLANPYFGSVVSESGSAYTWCENAHEYRLTPWANDALTDSTGEAFYIRDEDSGDFWSPTPLPAKADATYTTRHGFGYSSFEVDVQGVSSTLTTFVAIDAPIKMNLLRLRNNSGVNRKLSVTGYCEWVLGEMRAKSLMHVVSEVDPATNAMFVRNYYHPEFGGRIGFFDVSEQRRSITGDRSEFLGRNGRLMAPAAMTRAHLSDRVGAALDACSAMQVEFDLAPGEEHELVFVLGVGRDVDDARTLLRRFATPVLAHRALDDVSRHWQHCLGAVQVKTPDPSLNVLMNGWLVYQVMSSRLWGRSGYYQSGGAYGFRDQLQDTMALLHAEPKLCREHLLRCAARQFREGDVQHWWHPPSGFGVRTHFSDDYLWLPLATARYVLGIGDTGVLEKRVHFIYGRQVKLDEEAYGDLPARTDESASLYEHCVRAIKHGLRFGRHGLPLMGCGDWNDGMNLVGEHGKGESVWLAFFLCTVLEEFSAVAKLMGDTGFAEYCQQQSALLKTNIETNGWDGAWYRRAYFDNGEPLGSAQNTECQIDSIPQSWAILSGAARPERAKEAMEHVYTRLVDKENQLIKLFDPPFDRSQPNPGYIKGYVPGVRENGGQYTHAAIWAAMAFAEIGDQKRAWDLLAMMNPLHHGDSAEKIQTYKVEPYVVAADVYGVAPHTGRGGWTWYTGSAGWMYRLILESLLGLKLDVDKLSFAPCIPADWTDFEVRYRYRETFFDITVKTSGEPGAKTTVIVDGILQSGETILLIDDREAHEVVVTVAQQPASSPTTGSARGSAKTATPRTNGLSSSP